MTVDTTMLYSALCTIRSIADQISTQPTWWDAVYDPSGANQDSPQNIRIVCLCGRLERSPTGFLRPAQQIRLGPGLRERLRLRELSARLTNTTSMENDSLTTKLRDGLNQAIYHTVVTLYKSISMLT